MKYTFPFILQIGVEKSRAKVQFEKSRAKVQIVKSRAKVQLNYIEDWVQPRSCFFVSFINYFNVYSKDQIVSKVFF